jgi:hypothetical protein
MRIITSIIKAGTPGLEVWQYLVVVGGAINAPSRQSANVTWNTKMAGTARS